MPGKRSDQYKLGLVIEGGGMRGVISASMLMELKKLGLHNTVDCIYGASAGGIAAAYHLANTNYGLEFFTKDLASTEFVNAKGMKQGRPVINLDYLFEHIMGTVRPLDWNAVLTSPIPLKVVASSLDKLRPVLLEDFSCPNELKECLRASATVPRLVGPPRVVRGERLLDAAVFEPVPVESALRDGCTHVLVLCTRNSHVERGWRARLNRQVVRAIVHSWLTRPPYRPNPKYSFLETSKQLKRHHITEDLLVTTLNSCPHEIQEVMGAYVLPMYPTCIHGLHPLCIDVDSLEKGGVEGATVIRRAFSSITQTAFA